MTATAPSHTIHIVPDKSGSAEAEYSVHLSRKTLQVTRHSGDRLTIAECWEYQFNLCIDDQLWLETVKPILDSLDFKVDRILIELTAFQLVPKALFRSKDSSKILETSGVDLSGQTVLEYDLDETILLWTIPAVIAETLKAELIPDLAVNLSGLTSTDSKVCVVNRAERIDVLVVNNGIQLINSYSTPTHNDRLYFLVAACESCGMEAGKTVLEVHGSTEPELLKLLSSYFKEVKPAAVPEKMKVPYAFKDHDPTAWSALLNLHLCA